MRLCSAFRRAHSRTCRAAFVALVAVVALRAATLSDAPILDPTEARYAEIARSMANSGDWVTPRLWLDGNHIPYLGKPPLQFWLAAASLRAFGVSAGAVRLPNFLGGVLLVLIVAWFGSRRWGRALGIVAGIILASTILLQLLAGGSTLATTLAVPVTLAIVCFAVHAEGPASGRLPGYLFFASLGVALLSKGPIGAVLPALTIAGWATWTGNWRHVRRLPWLGGPLVTIVIAAPWYVLVERANPGFLRYFFYHEHVLRYLEPEYGDRYGRGHTYPYGMAWAMLAAALLPWTALFVAGLCRVRGRRVRGRADEGERFALVWGLVPVVFFTFARNVSPSYLLPGFGGLALFIARTLPAARSRLLRLHLLSSPLMLAGLAIALAALAEALALDAASGETLTQTVGRDRWLMVSGALAVPAAGVSWSLWRRGTTSGIIAHLSVSFAVTVACGSLAYRPTLAVAHSTEAVLEACRRIAPRKQVLFLHRTPASANFYAPERLVRMPGERSAAYRIIPPAYPLIIVKRDRWSRIQPLVAVRLKPLESVGTWDICRVE